MGGGKRIVVGEMVEGWELKGKKCERSECEKREGKKV